MDSVQHFELPYKSRDRAKKFYFDAFDWQLFDLPGSGYTLADSVEKHANGMPIRPGAINGGLIPRGETSQAPGLMVHVGDLRSALDRIRRHGGTILSEPVAMGPVVYARFRDPEGNVLSVFEDAPEAKGAAAKSSRRQTAKRAKKAPKRKPAKRSAKKAKPKKGKSSKKKR